MEILYESNASNTYADAATFSSNGGGGGSNLFVTRCYSCCKKTNKLWNRVDGQHSKKKIQNT